MFASIICKSQRLKIQPCLRVLNVRVLNVQVFKSVKCASVSVYGVKLSIAIIILDIKK